MGRKKGGSVGPGAGVRWTRLRARCSQVCLAYDFAVQSTRGEDITYCVAYCPAWCLLSDTLILCPIFTTFFGHCTASVLVEVPKKRFHSYKQR